MFSSAKWQSSSYWRWLEHQFIVLFWTTFILQSHSFDGTQTVGPGLSGQSQMFPSGSFISCQKLWGEISTSTKCSLLKFERFKCWGVPRRWGSSEGPLEPGAAGEPGPTPRADQDPRAHPHLQHEDLHPDLEPGEWSTLTLHFCSVVTHNFLLLKVWIWESFMFCIRRML